MSNISPCAVRLYNHESDTFVPCSNAPVFRIDREEDPYCTCRDHFEQCITSEIVANKDNSRVFPISYVRELQFVEAA